MKCLVNIAWTMLNLFLKQLSQASVGFLVVNLLLWAYKIIWPLFTV